MLNKFLILFFTLMISSLSHAKYVHIFYPNATLLLFDNKETKLKEFSHDTLSYNVEDFLQNMNIKNEITLMSVKSKFESSTEINTIFLSSDSPIFSDVCLYSNPDEEDELVIRIDN